MNKYNTYLYQVAYSVLHSTNDAEDLTQEALLKIYASLPQYQHQGFKTWITRITVNKAIDYKRSRERKREQLSDEPELLLPMELTKTVEDEVMYKHRRQRIREYLDEIPDNYRDVLVAFYIEDKSYQEIAVEQGVTLKTVESKLYRAKQWIRKHWREDEWR
ncbi:sigma-70 family RNA polymerase sigma factor [Paenibacillus sp. sptzw28]|uniref:RNA polymerase sigma factor n=1 Tax=Paenibacillus sp. sptzw28 TaxID=715179 RepID=UPI001C6DF16F|nr:sigma-70 family RNA polymerase sigma factor [Paenibacillus sp. sptzw28]QYR19274.1 sigma-70 family RNA polymerase sigma factor [Paenibacillus sp. sptzw28]